MSIENGFPSTPGLAKATRQLSRSLDAQETRTQRHERGVFLDSEFELLPQDLRTHLHDFRKACKIARDSAPPATADEDDASYWQHQLDVIDRIERMIARGPDAAPETDQLPSP